MNKAIAIGTSAGGIDALDYLLPLIPSNSSVSVFIVQHIKADSDSFFVRMMNKKCNIRVKEACHTEEIVPGVVYFAPPNYHLLIDDNFTLSLSTDEKVNFSRPSIDVLFESAADVYQQFLTGILLTGANNDGSKGLLYIHNKKGRTIVQNPTNAEVPEMPESAIKLFKPNNILDLNEIGDLFRNINSL
jgi:two-component system chemotaxis response regulator CheB